ncbi:hypothetical protein [Arcobacter defluvii]|uniref:Uncharacterized protein n=1 Tax=Arcobacter defluvii TaxID=873191 RepID=A0AAE7E5T5_9BACT|nr:hypothetical protein [Arcobacter defluvii]QKF76236.1 hypothetical protein ADFLV_0169 [Arcobacter defluvii]RXI30918.1 hypothetical protein CP964_10695 [Arcobacter defluvii]
MPQLIAMIIVVVGAMIYMFQTFGGTGDKIEGIAQKTSVITEINNIKNGLKLAARSGSIATADNATNDEYNKLAGIAKLKYFAEQINEQISKDKDGVSRTTTDFNTYAAISFGGNSDNATSATADMIIRLVANTKGQIPGIFVDLSRGGLKDGAGFLESQIANDLKSVATIDRKANVATATDTPAAGALRTTGTDVEKRIPVETTGADTLLNDGMFTIYFQDFGSNEVVIDNN